MREIILRIKVESDGTISTTKKNSKQYVNSKH